MMQIVTWLRDAKDATTKFAVDTYTQLKYTSNIVYSSLNYGTASNSFVQAWRGWATPYNTEIVPALVESPQLREASKLAFTYNVAFYLSKLLSYQLGKLALYSVIPGAEGSYAEWVLDAMATVYFLSQAVQVEPNNIILAADANKATEKYYNNKALFKGTKGKEIEAQQATYTAPIYNGSKKLIAKIVEWSPLPYPVNMVVSSGIEILADGQAYIDYNLEEMTLEERSKIHAENNAFLFGLGFSYWFMVSAIRYGIYHFTGANNFFIKHAVSGLVSPLFITATRLMEKPLTGKELGIDWFYYSNYVTEAVIKNSTDMILKSFNDPKYKIDWIKVKNGIQHFPPFDLITSLLFPREMLSIRRFVKTKPVQLYLDLKGDDIQSFIKKMMSYRDSTLVNWFPKRLLSEDTRKYLSVILTERMGSVFETVNTFITDARKKEKPVPLPEKPVSPGPIVREYEPNTYLLEDTTAALKPTVQLLEDTITVEEYGEENPPSSVHIEEIIETKEDAEAVEEFEDLVDSEEKILIGGNPVSIEEDWYSIKEQKSPPVYHGNHGLFKRQSTPVRTSASSKENELETYSYQYN